MKERHENLYFKRKEAEITPLQYENVVFIYNVHQYFIEFKLNTMGFEFQLILFIIIENGAGNCSLLLKTCCSRMKFEMNFHFGVVKAQSNDSRMCLAREQVRS